MKVILFGPDCEIIPNFETLIHYQLPVVETMHITSMKSLLLELRRPLNGIVVIIMEIPSEKEISQMLDLKPLLRNISLIFVSADDRTEIGIVATQLSPSFIGSSDNFSDILTVLKKIVDRIENRRRSSSL